MASLLPAELSLFKYHARCRKQVVHKLLVERAEKRRLCSPTSMTSSPKVGRLSVSDDRACPQSLWCETSGKKKTYPPPPWRYEGKEDKRF